MMLLALSDRPAMTAVSLGYGHDLPPFLEARPFSLFRRDHIRIDVDTRPKLLAYRIDEAVDAAEGPVMLVGLATACDVVAWWTKLSPARQVSRIAGALMIGPRRDPARPSLAAPQGRLPVPSLVIGADDFSQSCAGEWASRLLDGPAQGDGALLSTRLRNSVLRFTAAIISRDLARADRLLQAVGDS